MAATPFRFQPDLGVISDSDVRYVMMRPDVLMNAARALGAVEAFVAALDESAYANARASFESYVERGMMTRQDCLARTASLAGQLGWGQWTIAPDESEVQVRDSPFASGFGTGDIPVCGPISGVLRALLFVLFGEQARVREVACAAQGAECCRFALER